MRKAAGMIRRTVACGLKEHDSLSVAITALSPEQQP